MTAMKTWTFHVDPVSQAPHLVRAHPRKGTHSILIGSSVLILFLCAAVFGEFGYDCGIYPFSPNSGVVNSDMRDIPPSSAALSFLLDRRTYNQEGIAFVQADDQAGHLLGTDSDGRDIFIRVLRGAWTYLLPGFAVVSLSLVLGACIGSIAGYFLDTWASSVASYLITVVESFPRLVMLIGIAFLFDFRLVALVLTLGVLNSGRVARIVRTRVTALATSGFVEAARELGLSDFRIIVKHILWLHSRQLLLIQAISGFASIILVEATLMYVNSGLSEAYVSWGGMIHEGMGVGYADKFGRGMYWESVPAAVAIVATLLGLNLLADGLEKRFRIRGADSR